MFKSKDTIQKRTEEDLTSLPPSPSLHRQGETERHPLIRTVESGVVGWELTWFDDAARYGILLATFAATRSPELSAAAYGATTVLTEGAAAIAASDLLASRRGSYLVDKANRGLEKLGVTADAKTSKPAKAFIATYLGSAMLLAIKKREEPSITFRDSRRYGLKAASAVGAVCAAEGFAYTELGGTFADAINVMDEGTSRPEILIPALVALGGIVKAKSWAKKRLKKAEPEE